MLFGGFAQYVVAWLLEATGDQAAPPYDVRFGAAVGVVAAAALRERHAAVSPVESWDAAF